MKKVFVLILVLLVLLSLAACSGQSNKIEEAEVPTEGSAEAPTEAPTEVSTEAPTESPTEAPTEVSAEGSTDDSPLIAVKDRDVYENNFFGLTMNVLPEAVWYTEEEIEVTFGVTAESTDVEDMSVEDILPLCMCYTPSETTQVANMNILFSIESVPKNDGEATATAELSAQMLDSAFGTETIFAQPTATEFDGHSAYIIETQSYLGEEVALNQAVVMVEVEQGMLTITYTYFTEEQLEAAINSVKSISFSK